MLPVVTRRVGSKGQVVIPKELRERAGLHPGTEVDFEIDGDRITLVRHRPTLGGMFPNTGMAERLLEDRAREPR